MAIKHAARLRFRRVSRVVSPVVRAAAEQTGTSIPITIVEGDDAPQTQGKSYYWTTPSGKTIVRHPSAYKWPTLYHASTREIIVGRGWLAAKVGTATVTEYEEASAL